MPTNNKNNTGGLSNHSFDCYECDFSERVLTPARFFKANRFQQNMPAPVTSQRALIESFINNPVSMKIYMQEKLEVRQIGPYDPRGLAGQYGLFSKTLLPQYTVLGIYTGTYMTQDEFESHPEKLDIEIYAFETGPDKLHPVIDGRKGNMLAAINASMTYKPGSVVMPKNAEFGYYQYIGIRYIICYTNETILANQELLVDYGKSYWDMINSRGKETKPMEVCFLCRD